MRTLLDLNDAFWRALASCLRPRVMLLGLLPLLLSGVLAGALGYAYWQDATDAVAGFLSSWGLVGPALGWLDAAGGQALRLFLVPLIVVALALPVLVMLTLLIVAWLLGPRLVAMVAERRFPQLQRRGTSSLWPSLAHSLIATVIALIALVVTLPLWLVWPLALLLPTLIWGWLNAEVMAYDALAVHASADERRSLLRAHRWPLLLIGIASAAAGAAPALLWAFSAATLVLAPILIVVSVWIYTLVFIGASLWFAHYALAALQALRRANDAVVASPAALDLRDRPPLVQPALEREP
jgi:Etoposide-induced protein 2.4 (EI24)